MDAHNLGAFLQVARHRSFSRAAESLHLTQPAVSKRIALLEEQLGKKLFDRIGHHVSLTEAGELLLPRAQHILQSIEATRQELNDMSGAVGGRLQLATSHHIGLHRLPPLLQTYKKHYPDVDLQLSFADSEAALEAINKGEIELGIITLPLSVPDHLTAIPVWNDRLHFVAAAAHSLASTEFIGSKRRNLQALLDFPAILPEHNTITTRIVRQMFDQQNLNLSVQMPTNFLETIRMMVSIGLGWSVLPETLIDETLVRLELPAIELHRQLGYVHHRDRTLSNAARAMLSLMEPDKNKEA